MAHTLPDLPFSKSALEPFISEETILIHYGKHHRGYVNRLNDLIKGTSFEKLNLTETMNRSTGDIFHNAAQAWNHEFYWQGLTPQSHPPKSHLAYAINHKFGDFTTFNKALKRAGMDLFGSGWVWLVLNLNGQLEIETTQNAGNPIRHDSTPLLAIDVWEHAYYLDYQNERMSYLDAVFNVLNWKFAEQNFISALHAFQNARRVERHFIPGGLA